MSIETVSLVVGAVATVITPVGGAFYTLSRRLERLHIEMEKRFTRLETLVINGNGDKK